jgi:hypothetical protein
MTALMTVLLAGGTVSASTTTADHARQPALVVDAALGRHGRELVDPRLSRPGVELRLPRTPSEAATDVRYLQATGHQVTAVGPQSEAALAAIRR